MTMFLHLSPPFVLPKQFNSVVSSHDLIHISSSLSTVLLWSVKMFSDKLWTHSQVLFFWKVLVSTVMSCLWHYTLCRHAQWQAEMLGSFTDSFKPLSVALHFSFTTLNTGALCLWSHLSCMPASGECGHSIEPYPFFVHKDSLSIRTDEQLNSLRWLFKPVSFM